MLTQLLPVLLQRPEHLLWAFCSIQLPDALAALPSEPIQGLLRARVAADVLAAAEGCEAGAAEAAALLTFAQAAAADEQCRPLTTVLAACAVAEVMRPLWPQLEREFPSELLESPQSVSDAAPAPAAAQSRIYEHLTVSNAAAVRSALQLWPSRSAHDSNGASTGLCGLNANTVDSYIVVKVLSGATSAADSHTGGTASSGAEAVAYCTPRLDALPAEHRVALLEWAIAEGPCPGALWDAASPVNAAQPAPAPLPLHPHVQLQLLEHTQLSLDAAPLSERGQRAAARLASWRAIHSALAQADPEGASKHGDEFPLALEEADEAWELAQQADAADDDAAAVVAAGVLRAGARTAAVAAAASSTAAAYGRAAQGANKGENAELASVLEGVYEAHVTSGVQSVRQEVARGADEGDAAGARALWDIEKALDSLSGEQAGAMSCIAQLRTAAVRPLRALHDAASGAELQHPLMRALMALQADLNSPDKWGDYAGDSGEGDQAASMLQLQTRAALASGFGDAVAPTSADLRDAATAAAFLERLIGGTTDAAALHACYAVLAGEWQFGRAFGDCAHSSAPDAVPMHATCCALGCAFASAGMNVECANLMHMRCAGADANADVALLSDDEMVTVLDTLEATSGPAATTASALGSGASSRVARALQQLPSPQLEQALAADAPAPVSAHVAATMLWGLSMVSMREAQRTLSQDAAKHAVVSAARRLLPIGMSSGVSLVARRTETAFAGLLIALCTGGTGGGILLAAELAADYVGMHEGMRVVSGEIGALKQYLKACRARLTAAGAPARLSGDAWAEVAEVLLPRAGDGDVADGLGDALDAIERACVSRF